MRAARLPNPDARLLLISRLSATDQVERKRACCAPEAESPEAQKRPPLAALQFAFVAGKKVVGRHGRWSDPVTDGAPVNGMDAAISSWTADLRGKTLGKGPMVWERMRRVLPPRTRVGYTLGKSSTEGRWRRSALVSFAVAIPACHDKMGNPESCFSFGFLRSELLSDPVQRWFLPL